MTKATLDMIRKITTSASGKLETVRRNRQAAAVQESEKALEASRKGLFSSAKYKTARNLRRAGGILNIAFIGKSLYDVAKAGKEHGLEEAGKVALRETIATAPYFIPYLGLGLGATDVARMIRGQKGLVETGLDELYNYAPGLKPIESEEEQTEELVEDDNDSVEFEQSQAIPQLALPNEHELRKRQRINEARVRAYQEGRRIQKEGLSG